MTSYGNGGSFLIIVEAGSFGGQGVVHGRSNSFEPSIGFSKPPYTYYSIPFCLKWLEWFLLSTTEHYLNTRCPVPCPLAPFYRWGPEAWESEFQWLDSGFRVYKWWRTWNQTDSLHLSIFSAASKVSSLGSFSHFISSSILSPQHVLFQSNGIWRLNLF